MSSKSKQANGSSPGYLGAGMRKEYPPSMRRPGNHIVEGIMDDAKAAKFNTAPKKALEPVKVAA